MAQEKLKKESKPSWRHHNLVTAGPVDDYLYSMLPERDEVLTEMEGYATEHDVPIVGPAVARVLQQLALTIQARTVFELGSAIGYSTIWWAQAVGEKGRVIYTDGDPKNADRARRYFDRAGVASRVTIHTATPSNSSPSRSSNTTSSSMTSTKKTIRACCAWSRRACAEAACLLQTMFCGADKSRRRIPRSLAPRRSSSSTACFTIRTTSTPPSCRFAMAWRSR